MHTFDKCEDVNFLRKESKRINEPLPTLTSQTTGHVTTMALGVIYINSSCVFTLSLCCESVTGSKWQILITLIWQNLAQNFLTSCWREILTCLMAACCGFLSLLVNVKFATHTGITAERADAFVPKCRHFTALWEPQQQPQA